MEQTIGVTEARTRFSELVDQVRYQGTTVTLLKSGKPAAVLVPVELFERWKAERRDALAPMRRIQANVTEPLSDEEAMLLAVEAQEAVRTQSSSPN
ncbi:MAG: type II toxin-antitoxin system Phd/YefM family antitoxin [Caldilineaceae bacterium]|nr:type II toxin-antitoxin system Phd/YefM family antitoxin [Caldilineaceae bacterium]